LIPGGGDVNPSLYSEINTMSEWIDTSIDRLDMTLIGYALKHHLEIFGICRGQQIINVALQGTLIQDIPSSVKTELDHSYSEHHSAPTQGHLIKVKSGSRLSTLLPPEIIVNSYHHQAIKKLAENCSVSALSEDGIIEAIEGPHLLAVQWHPERMIEDPLFQSLFDDFIQRCL
jgi:putative glutamine amidotransferase